MDINQMAYVQLLKTISDTVTSNADTTSYDNTIIQFFEAPQDIGTVSAWFQAYVNGTSILSSPNENPTVTASMSAKIYSPSIAWDSGGTWGVGGTWT